MRIDHYMFLCDVDWSNGKSREEDILIWIERFRRMNIKVRVVHPRSTEYQTDNTVFFAVYADVPAWGYELLEEKYKVTMGEVARRALFTR